MVNQVRLKEKTLSLQKSKHAKIVKSSKDSVGPLRKYSMWYEVHRLNDQGLNKSQISKELEMDRGSVRKYLRMNEAEFLASESYQRQYDLKLDKYETYVVDLQKGFPFLSAAQIEDRLKEHYGTESITACSKTIYNFVAKMREKHGLPKRPEDNPRPYEMLEETPYGEYAQVDFGEKYMSREGGGHIKVYFFAMVLSRSRQKFIWFSTKPFTTALAIYAHELAFKYFGGIPRKILYDQDKVFIKDENLGAYLLTHSFKAFVAEQHFETVFCHKSDPESKGKVENVVKYVKINFLPGRLFKGIDILNTECEAWLSRTANGTIHHTTHRIPSEVFKEEQPHLMPYYGIPALPQITMEERHLRKDNVVSYHCSFYAVPTGTYKGPSSSVFVEEKEGILYIYSKETGKTLAEHPVTQEKGKLVSNGSMRRDSQSSFTDLENQIREYVGESEALELYLSGIHQDKSRYYRDNLCHIIHHMGDFTPETLIESLAICMSARSYVASSWMETARTVQKKKGEKPQKEQKSMQKAMADAQETESNWHHLQPSKTNIKTYQSLFV